MTIRHRTLQSVVCGLLACALAARASAQVASTGELRGTVRDQTGGVVAGASVALHARDGRLRSTTTDRDGRYRLDRVPAGHYTLVVRRAGFMEITSDVDLRSERTISRDVVLQVAIAVSVDVKEREGLSTEPRKNLS